jgi:hypothetical protein
VHVPRYVYEILDLQKIGIFSKDVKKLTPKYRKLLPELVKRAPIVWRWETRYKASKTNRSFKKDWYRDHGSLEGLPPRVHRVYTGRPKGDGPLVKIKRHQGRIASGWATAQEHKRVQKRKLPLGSFGPIRPLRTPEGSNPYVIPMRRTGKTELKRSKIASRQSAQRAAGRVSAHANQLIGTYLKGKSYVLPEAHHKKYWYFLRKRGYYTFSEHHPYGDEVDLVVKRINEDPKRSRRTLDNG